MDIVFAKEKLQDVIEEARVLWILHWRETEMYREKEGFAPDIESLLSTERSGHSILYTARHDGDLVGHLSFLIYKSMQTQRTNAVEEYFYLLPQFRKGFNALRLIKFAVNDLRELGCSGITMTCKTANDISPLLKRAGFSHVANLFYMGV